MKAYVLADLGFGDSGKGSVVDYLCRQEDCLVVRSYGGAQAGHRVVDKNHEHIFNQYGSGTLAGAPTYLGPMMMVNPQVLLQERLRLKRLSSDFPTPIYVSPKCRVTTVFHIAANRLMEIYRDKDRHGSCGMGIGVTAKDHLDRPGEALTVGDLGVRGRVQEKLHELVEYLLRNYPEALEYGRVLDHKYHQITFGNVEKCISRETGFFNEFLETAIVVGESVRPKDVADGKTLVFEPSQSVLLDEWRGFHPHTTWATTTFEEPDKLLMACGIEDEDRSYIGVMRTHQNRHGAGPMPSAGRYPPDLSRLTEDHNCGNEWQGLPRFGCLDLVMTNYALDVLGYRGRLRGLAVNFMDVGSSSPVVTSYPYNPQGDAADTVHLDASWRVSGLRRSPVRKDLAYQGRMTKFLLGLNTQDLGFEYPTKLPGGLLPLLKEQLQVPVWLTGYGPRADQKYRYCK